jgi:hypothetical protein
MGQSLANYHKANMGKHNQKKSAPPSRRAMPKASPPAAKAAPEPPPEITNAKGLTRDGKPRQRAYRTYFGVTDAGRVIKYANYEAREIDVKEGRVRRVTAHEAREIEARGARPQPLIVSTQWSPTAGGKGAATETQSSGNASGLPPNQTALPSGLIEAKAILNVITNMVGELAARIDRMESGE